MVFEDVKLDKIIESYNIIQFAFLTKDGAKEIKSRFIDNLYQDVTYIFTSCDPKLINVDLASKILNDKDSFIDINELYRHWIFKEGKSYKDATWSLYFLLDKLIPLLEKKLFILSYKRTLQEAKQYGGNVLDTVLFCDYIDLFIYPVYQEFKLFSDNLDLFNKYREYIMSTGEIVEKYNTTSIQYMKHINHTDRIIH
jgi:hypothetical protein